MKISELYDNYLQLKIEPSSRSEETKVKYRYYSRLIAQWFDYEAETMLASTYQRIMNKLGETHSRDYLRRLNAVIYKSIRMAQADKMRLDDFTITYEPFTQVKPQSRQDKFLHTQEDYETLTTGLRARFNYERSIMPFIGYFLLKTGMRYSELIALTWDDVSWENETFYTHRRYATKSRGFVPSKNENSIRLVPLTAELIELLKKMKDWQASYNHKYQRTNDENFIFQHFRLLKFVPSSEAVNRYLAQVQTALKLSPVLTTKGCRHSFISMCLFLGLTQGATARLCGHVNTDMIIKVYGGELDNSVIAAFSKIKNEL